ncbi:hypothetical protein [Crassaminicella indica]|uniref:Uracil DNA glycosylase superfamily protein n=1 Tax=Crassaminicella indica TaxID=2855394 RepID=A0ABX8R8T2_9CLOT|nr:hypothetical protein [Crassaminicella indica]QXM05459.1 hypothetical protein KVH43_08690 [Crassaminicella indica]
MEELIRLYKEMIEFVNKKNIRTKDKKLTSLFHVKGNLYKGDLMIIGRAVNGWDEGEWVHGELNSIDEIERYVEKIMNISITTERCPLKWVKECWGNTTGYNTKKSAFWRTVQKLLIEKELKDYWWSRIIWTNLYKIAPYEGNNPKLTLMKLQLDKCCEILKKEIEIYRPQNIVCFTGVDWFEVFSNRIDNINLLEVDDKTVDAVGKYMFNDNTFSNIIIAKHPQGKDENMMVHEIQKYCI